MREKERQQEILKRLNRKYRHITRTFLEYGNPLEIMVATILSAQCTDKRVNMVTPALFAKYRTVSDYANASIDELRNDIRSISYPNSKSKNIISACKKIISDFNGKIPKKMEELITLPGVGRKTANIVQSEAFGMVEGMAVDTHVSRVAFRLGLTKHKDPKKIEQDLLRIVPKNQWGNFSVRTIQHGRDTCVARKPKCSECFLADICPKNGVTKSA